jgi:hypothetical protein
MPGDIEMDPCWLPSVVGRQSSSACGNDVKRPDGGLCSYGVGTKHRQQKQASFTLANLLMRLNCVSEKKILILVSARNSVSSRCFVQLLAE